jgi:hypothetical protein
MKKRSVSRLKTESITLKTKRVSMLIRKGIKLKTSAHMTNANQDVSNAVGMKFANIKR